MAYTPANGLAINGNFVSSGAYTPANGLNILGNFSEGEVLQKRALILMEGRFLAQIPDDLIGTNQHPLVLLNSSVYVRDNTDEGSPLVLSEDGFRLRIIRENEQLII